MCRIPAAADSNRNPSAKTVACAVARRARRASPPDDGPQGRGHFLGGSPALPERTIRNTPARAGQTLSDLRHIPCAPSRGVRRWGGAFYLPPWTLRDSNPAPPACKAGTLPDELRARASRLLPNSGRARPGAVDGRLGGQNFVDAASSWRARRAGPRRRVASLLRCSRSPHSVWGHHEGWPVRLVRRAGPCSPHSVWGHHRSERSGAGAHAGAVALPDGHPGEAEHVARTSRMSTSRSVVLKSALGDCPVGPPRRFHSVCVRVDQFAARGPVYPPPVCVRVDRSAARRSVCSPDWTGPAPRKDTGRPGRPRPSRPTDSCMGGALGFNRWSGCPSVLVSDGFALAFAPGPLAGLGYVTGGGGRTAQVPHRGCEVGVRYPPGSFGLGLHSTRPLGRVRG